MTQLTNTISARSPRLAIIANQAFSIVNFRGPLIRAMVARGVTVYAFASDYDEKTKASVQSIGAIPVDYSLSRTGLNPFRDVVDLFKLARQLGQLKIDMSFAYFIKPVIYGTLAAYVAGVAKRFVMIEGAGYVFTESGNALTIKRRLLRTVAKKLYRLGLSKAHTIFLLNPDDERMFVEERMAPREKICLLNGIGLDLDHFQVAPTVTSPLTFILVARLLREKGIFDYVEAARIVKAQHPDVKFVLLGDVDLNPGSISEAQAHAWVQEGLVTWPGHVSDVRLWIAQASVFVLPSYREGLPRSTQEAMAMGRPVITTDAPGCRETVQQGENGYIVPVRDPAALAAAMLRFVDDPELIQKMGGQSRRWALEKYNVHEINSLILGRMGL
jgi:glycosyltransferase involved in cell wall biosynthesis